MIKKKEDGFEGERRITVPPIVIKQYLKSDIFKNLFITDIGYYPKAKHHFCNRPTGCDEHILIHCVDGKGKITIKQTEYGLSRNQFIFIPANTAHSYEADKQNPWTIYWMHINGSLSFPIIKNIYEKTGSMPSLLVLNDNHLKIFDKLYQLLLYGYSKDHMIEISLCLPFFMSKYLFSKNNNMEKEEDIIQQSINFIQTNMDKKITLRDLSNHIHLSVSHFSKIFKNKTGYSPIEYLNHLKIQKACSLLQFSKKRISQISYEIGFEDQYYFSRLFKQHMGVSPTIYRKNLDSYNENII